MTYARNTHRWLAALIVGGLVFGGSVAAHAQINPFRGYKGPTLSKEDLAAGQAAAQKLLNDDQAQPGRSEDWAGPASGNTGTMTVQKAFKRQGMDCRQLRSEIRYKTAVPSSPRVFNLNVCHTHNGEWKLN
jgi:surface antigen